MNRKMGYYLILTIIVLDNKIYLVLVEGTQFTRMPKMDKNHPIFKQLSMVYDFDYYYINKI